MTNQVKRLTRIAHGRTMSHSAGFSAHSIGRLNLGDETDPFIQLDHFRMSQPTFGPHPHAGFSAVTYMFEDSAGSFLNRDTMGGRELIRPGDLHWSQAGSGLMHDEAPTEPGVECHGLQMFINLAARNKRLAPQAFHLNSADVPTLTDPNGTKVRVVAGEKFGLASPLQAATAITLLDVQMPAQQRFTIDVPEGENAFVLVVKGRVNFDASKPEQWLTANDGGLFEGAGHRIEIATDTESAQFVYCAGQPLREPIYAHGPFIMNNEAQVLQAVSDFKAGKMGNLK